LSFFDPSSTGSPTPQSIPTVDLTQVQPFSDPVSSVIVGALDTIFNGQKFATGLGPAAAQPAIDYNFLRAYSWKLFYENSYARGILSRLITNEVGTGLRLESTPVAELLNISPEDAREWSSDVESKFRVWASNPHSVDWSHQFKFTELQRTARLHSLISGDVLFVLRYPAPLNLPVVELIDGARVATPFDSIPSKGNKIINGVEVDEKGRHVAYHVIDNNNDITGFKTKRIAAFGSRSGRRMSWLMYSGARRLGQTRGVPLLAAILQSLKEIDRYRDAEQRAAVVNAFYALSIERENAATIQSNSITGGAVRRDTVTEQTAAGTAQIDFSAQIPGVQLESLGVGEKLVSHSTARPNVNFGGFEEAIISACAWGEEIPPEILRMSFSSNYSASKAAVNEFNAYLKWRQNANADQSTKPVYEEWLVGKALLGDINAPGLLESRRDPRKRDTVAAWLMSEWPGPIKPSVDLGKDVKAYVNGINEGLVTRERASADLFGVRYDETVKRLKDENERLSDANESLIEQPAAITTNALLDEVKEVVEDVVDNRG